MWTAETRGRYDRSRLRYLTDQTTHNAHTDNQYVKYKRGSGRIIHGGHHGGDGKAQHQ